MADKFKNKYRIGSARRPNWDYGTNASYFVTICTKNRACFFGDIVDAQCIANLHRPIARPHHQSSEKTMVLSPIGQIVENEWLKTFSLRKDMNLEMDEFQIMPNHIHVIIIIGENEYNRGKPRKSAFGPQSKNLSSIMRGFKSAVTIKARKVNPTFGWQSRFHDHIIRDHQSYLRIARYIQNNPANWDTDKFYGEV